MSPVLEAGSSLCWQAVALAIGDPTVWPRDRLKYNGGFMTAYVYVSLKKSVLDPQGKTIQGALKKMGYKGLESVRQGKYFELTLDTGCPGKRPNPRWSELPAKCSPTQ